MSANLFKKNDQAWKTLFHEEKILENIEKYGYFQISSERINQEREARLMTKFDHQFQRPKIFKDNNLSIQPNSRGRYVIGAFSSYFSIPENKASFDVKYLQFPPHIKTIVPNLISSESSAILCAHLSGMLEEILGEETYFTVFGRMSTGIFDYKIDNLKTGGSNQIRVENAQCEIDGGFEGESKFAIIEAKCQSVDDFIVRQLYYPYRAWELKVNKEIVPIFLSVSNNIFTFYVFKFLDSSRYNSIHLESVHRYCIGQYEIELSDIREIIKNIQRFKDDKGLTFPQADTFIRVIDLLEKLYVNESPLRKEEITTNYAFDVRQTDYYISAGIYLGLFEKLRNNGSVYYSLSPRGKEIIELDPKRRNLELVKTILSYKVFYLILCEYLNSSEKPKRERIIEIMRGHVEGLNQNTISRRAQTVEKWIKWILELTST